MQLIWTLLLWLSLFSQAQAEEVEPQLVNCDPGTSWVKENIRFECLTDPGSKGFKASGCLTDDKTVMEDGDRIKMEKFIYECQRQDALTYKYFVQACVTPAKVVIQIGAQVKEDGGWWVCIKDIESLEVKRIFSKKLECSKNGKTYDKDERFVEGEAVWQCDFYKEKLQVVPWGCVMADGRELRPFATANDQDAGSVYCHVVYGDNPSAKLEPIPDVCTDQDGTKRAMREKWVYDQVEYYCDVRRGAGSDINNPVPEIKPRACLKQIKYSRGVQKLKVFINRAKKAKNGKYYTCVPQDGNPDAKRPYEMVEIPAAKTRCPNGKKLLTQWFVNNVLHKCKWSKDSSGPLEVDIACASDNMRFRVKKGEIKEKAVGEAYICKIVPGSAPHKLVFRKLTPDEYYNFKAYGEIDSASGSFGRGIKMIDKDGNPVCAEGYEWKEERCQDINECEEMTATCGTRERCQNVDGRFDCLCIYGFARDFGTGLCQGVHCGC